MDRNYIQIENGICYFINKVSHHIINNHRSLSSSKGANLENTFERDDRFSIDFGLNRRDEDGFSMENLNKETKFVMIEFRVSHPELNIKDKLVEQWSLECSSGETPKNAIIFENSDKLYTKFKVLFRSILLLSMNIPLNKLLQTKGSQLKEKLVMTTRVITDKILPEQYIGWKYHDFTARFENEFFIRQANPPRLSKFSLQLIYLSDLEELLAQPTVELQKEVEEIKQEKRENLLETDPKSSELKPEEEPQQKITSEIPHKIERNEEKKKSIEFDHNLNEISIKPASSVRNGRIRSGSEQIFTLNKKPFEGSHPRPTDWVGMFSNSSLNGSPKDSVTSNPPFEIRKFNWSALENRKKGFDRKSLSNENLQKMAEQESNFLNVNNNFHFEMEEEEDEERKELSTEYKNKNQKRTEPRLSSNNMQAVDNLPNSTSGLFLTRKNSKYRARFVSEEYEDFVEGAFLGINKCARALQKPLYESPSITEKKPRDFITEIHDSIYETKKKFVTARNGEGNNFCIHSKIEELEKYFGIY